MTKGVNQIQQVEFDCNLLGTNCDQLYSFIQPASATLSGPDGVPEKMQILKMKE